MEFVLTKRKTEAERKKSGEAQGIADYQHIINTGLYRPAIASKQIKTMKELALSPNAKVIVMGKAGTPLIINGKE